MKNICKPARNSMKINNTPVPGYCYFYRSGWQCGRHGCSCKEDAERNNTEMPDGYKPDTTHDQGYESAVANDGFILNLIISVNITVVAVCFSLVSRMGY